MVPKGLYALRKVLYSILDKDMVKEAVRRSLPALLLSFRAEGFERVGTVCMPMPTFVVLPFKSSRLLSSWVPFEHSFIFIKVTLSLSEVDLELGRLTLMALPKHGQAFALLVPFGVKVDMYVG